MGHQLNEEVVDVILTRSLVVAKGFHICFQFRDFKSLYYKPNVLARSIVWIRLLYIVISALDYKNSPQRDLGR